MVQGNHFGSSWQGSLTDLASILQHIRRSHAFGRLSLRNSDQLSIAHLYFRAGKLVHVVGHRGDARTILTELQGWRRANVRFDRSVTTVDVTTNDEHERLLDNALVLLAQAGVLSLPQPAQLPPLPGPSSLLKEPQNALIVESEIIETSEARQLIAPWEWRVLVEGTRRVSLAVAHLVGPKEAFTVLQDILDDCSSTFPAFATLKIATTGYLQITDRSHLDHMSREDLLEGFTALIAICQHFCSPIIGEKDAHQLIIQALRELGPALVNLGVFRVDYKLLSSRN